MPVEEQEDGRCAGKKISTCEQDKAIRQRFFCGGIRFALADQAHVFKAYGPALQDRLVPSEKRAATWYHCLRAKWTNNVEVRGNLASGNIKWDSSLRQHLSGGKIYSSDDFAVGLHGTRRCSFGAFRGFNCGTSVTRK
jgi:hypothetical protein